MPRGEIACDSLTYRNYQFTKVLGPIWIDNNRVLFGRWADAKPTMTPRRMTAKVYGGTLLADCQVHVRARCRNFNCGPT